MKSVGNLIFKRSTRADSVHIGVFGPVKQQPIRGLSALKAFEPVQFDCCNIRVNGSPSYLGEWNSCFSVTVTPISGIELTTTKISRRRVKSSLSGFFLLPCKQGLTGGGEKSENIDGVGRGKKWKKSPDSAGEGRGLGQGMQQTITPEQTKPNKRAPLRKREKHFSRR
ncbi:hypothetical protein CEXT_732671 [Caerostris extrusa]|uniref:Uncharacterized protein n=1 Tax=Caerostris extrusa TaxID=172846 RepID=A0AAV4R257_CAEEX|nr:hypothetical protein CEXT_732671 [Caerostris extrusa]